MFLITGNVYVLEGGDVESDHPLLPVGKQTMGNEEFILLLSLDLQRTALTDGTYNTIRDSPTKTEQ